MCTDNALRGQSSNVIINAKITSMSHPIRWRVHCVRISKDDKGESHNQGE